MVATTWRGLVNVVIPIALLRQPKQLLKDLLCDFQIGNLHCFCWIVLTKIFAGEILFRPFNSSILIHLLNKD